MITLYKDVHDLAHDTPHSRTAHISQIKIVDGLLALDGCPIYDRLLINGSLDLTGNQDIVRLPDVLGIQGHLTLKGCTNLKSIGRQIIINGAVDITETHAESLPDVLVAMSLDMSGTEYAKIPGDLRCLGLNVNGCSKLESIEGVEIDQLDAIGCASLHKIASSSIDMIHLGKAPIIELGPDLTCKHLEVRHCANLMTIPAEMGLDRVLIIESCRRLRPLPPIEPKSMMVLDGIHYKDSGILCSWITKSEAAWAIGRELREVMPHYLLRDHPIMRRPVKSISRHEFNGENMAIAGMSSISLVSNADLARNAMEDRISPHMIPEALLELDHKPAKSANLPALVGSAKSVRKPKVLSHERRMAAKSRRALAKFLS